MAATDTYAAALSSLRSAGNLRTIPADTLPGCVDLSSNDYLGLASRHDLQEAFMASEANRHIPMTSSASRLLCGRQGEYAALEGLLSELYGREALLFNSGYHANTGLVQALADKETLVVADRLIHASVIDGIVLSRAPFVRFRHNDYTHLVRILEKEADRYARVLIIVESVYSMDGDRADLEQLIDIRSRWPQAMLYVDEAHAFGVLGPGGLGLGCEAARRGEVDVLVGTFGKACASMGAFCATSDTIRDYLVNRARSLIFSTALPPICAAWTEHIIRSFLTMDAERAHLQALGSRLAHRLGAADGSHIIPFMTGSAEKAVGLSHKLLEEGFKVLPIRTPTVPPGTERLRISLSAALSGADIDNFADSLLRLAKEI